MTPEKRAELARLVTEAEDWERDGFVATAANNVTKVWAARAKSCAPLFRALLQETADLEKEVAELKRAIAQVQSDDFDREEFS